MTESKLQFADLAKKLRAAERILLLTHAHPDGDTLGSAFALAAALPNQDVRVAGDDLLPERLAFLTEGSKLWKTEELSDFEPDLIVTVDVASLHLISKYQMEAYGDRIDVKIDHHESATDFGSEHYVDPSAAACGELIYFLICELGTMNSRSADALYAAISSDTGGFRYQNTTPRTHRIAAELIEAGARFADIDHLLYESRTYGEIQAMRLVYEKVKFFENGEIAFCMLTNVEKNRYGITEADAGVTNSILREIAGVRLGIMMKQSARHPNEYRISMRTAEGVSATKLCQLFGGGGHLRASGASLEADLPEEAEQYLLSTVLAAYEEAKDHADA